MLKSKGKRRFRSGRAGADAFVDEFGDVIVRTQATAAKAVGISERTLREWLGKGCPRRQDGYCIREILRWDAEQRVDDEDDLLSGGGTSPALERYRDEKAKLARMERLRQEGKLMWVEDAKAMFEPLTSTMRYFGDRFRTEFGNAGVELHTEMVEEASRHVIAAIDALHKLRTPNSEE